MEQPKRRGLGLRCLNHISRVCRDVPKTAAFYRDVLGFHEVKRPSSFEFEGAWLFNYGVGIHLIAGQPLARNKQIDPKADHLSFQVDSLEAVESELKELGLQYVKQQIHEGGVMVTQLFFHDPDNNMIEICNCDLLPVVLLDDDCTTACTACMAASFSISSEVGVSREPSPSCLPPKPSLPGPPTNPHSPASSSCSSMASLDMHEAGCVSDVSMSAGSDRSSMESTASQAPTPLPELPSQAVPYGIRGSTPHTGPRLAGYGLRRACSASFLSAGCAGALAPAPTAPAAPAQYFSAVTAKDASGLLRASTTRPA